MSLFVSLLRSALLQMDTYNAVSTGKVTKAVVVLSCDGDQIILPVVPSNLPELTIPQNNDKFDSILGDMSVIGTMGLRTLKLEGLLPSTADKYSWSYSLGNDADDVINFVNQHRLNRMPFRITITQAEACYLNMQVLVDSFSYYCDNVGDFHYSMDLTEYRVRDNSSGGLVS